MSANDQSAYYVVARMVGNIGTGFASGAMLSTAYFATPGILRKNVTPQDRLRSFSTMSVRSSFWLTRIVIPSAVAYIYTAYSAPVSTTDDLVSGRTLMAAAASCAAAVIPYSYFKLSPAFGRLKAAGTATEVDTEKKMGIQVVDDDIVEKDLATWAKGEKVRGWMVLTAFIIGTAVEVCYL